MILARRTALAGLAAIGLQFCLPRARAQSAPPPRKLVLLQYSMTPDLGDAPLWIVPHALGYFAQEGLDVSIQLMGAATAMQLIAAGRGDIATTTPDQMMIAVQQGIKIKSFFEHNRTYGSALVVPTTAGIKTTEELKTYLKSNPIGVASLASARIHYARAWLRELGLVDGTDASIVPVGPSGQAAAALQAKRIGALVSYDAGYAAIESSTPIRFTRFETSWQGSLFSGVITAKEDMIAKEPETLAKFGRAVAKALVFSTTNPEAVVRIFWTLYPESRPTPENEAKQLAGDIAIVNSMLPNWKHGSSGKNWGSQTKEEWEQMQKFNKDAGVVAASLPVESYFTNELASSFNAFDDEEIRAQAKGFKPEMVVDKSPS